MKQSWHYVQNVFDNVTKGNYLLMLKISTWHINALKAKAGDPYYDQLIADYQPLHDAVVDEYNKWSTSKGTHVGGTASFEDLLELLSGTKAEDWDIAIQAVYRRDTPQYLALLPNYRKPFQKGSRDARVNAVNNLITAIGTDAALAALKAQLVIFLGLLNAARTAQQSALSNTGDFSEDVEVVRIAAAEGQYRSLGSLMNKFYKTPVAIEPFFDLLNIRKASQTEFTGTIKKEIVETIFKRTLEPETEIRLINEGTVALKFAFVPEKNDPIGAAFLLVQPGEEEVVAASSLGNVPESKYLNVKNDSTIVDGKFTVEIL
jgi:hypothetical protein